MHHLGKLVAVNLVFIPFLLATLRMRERAQHHFPDEPVNSLGLLERAAGWLLFLFQFLQLVYKFLRGWQYVPNMLYPCHAVGALELYSFFQYRREHRRASVAFNLAGNLLQFVVIALAIPDIEDVRFPFQVEVFWGHHIMLFVYPCVMIVMERYGMGHAFLRVLSWRCGYARGAACRARAAFVWACLLACTCICVPLAANRARVDCSFATGLRGRRCLHWLRGESIGSRSLVACGSWCVFSGSLSPS